MKKLFRGELFNTEEEARAYVKRRRLRKYSLRYAEALGRWQVTHAIYI